MVVGQARRREARRPLGAQGRARPVGPQAAQSGRAARERPRRTYGGVDVKGNTKEELYERAKKLDVHGRSSMSKEELAEAIAKRQ